MVQDKLRSVRALVRRSDGAWIEGFRYGPYGAVIESAGSGGPTLRYRWTGREYDAETGFYFFRSRYYDPGARRFVQEDAIGYGGGPNLYAYGNGAGNVVEGRDPDGLTMNYEAYADPAPPCLSSLCRGPAIYIDGALVSSGGAMSPAAAMWFNHVQSLMAMDARLRAAEGRRVYRAYADYRRNFPASAEEAAATIELNPESMLLDPYGPLEAKALRSHSQPLTLSEFVVVRNLIDALPAGLERRLLGLMLSRGEIFVNNFLPGSAYFAGSNRAFNYIALHFAFFGAGRSPADMQHSLVHEYGHWYLGTVSEGLADVYACRIIPSASAC